ncbi:HisA/HisF-related TIM barrel protein [Clostridium sporogenes]|uniref:HisA/HisF-related TIM barrel protein n=1 Tax=Clostridium sporogenes TaxID=1509 RepID=UPI0006B2A41E|nr:HisA/HisF-related TIM barrel protein [Clostridium sporogenes]KOY65412.1 hypothetical protein AN649_13105 [Clostridium sporogenes]MDS1006658.1 HisA/HisF-related TIM barrel protein [Clostridium sporogenes]
MEVIAVLDLKDGQVVHGIKGERDKYKPIESYLLSSSEPIEIVKAIYNKLGIQKFYIADLNAILGNGDNKSIIIELVQKFSNIDFYLDAGINSVEVANEFINIGINKVIIGSETLNDLNEIRTIIESISPDKIIFSLDMQDGILMSRCKQLNGFPVQDAFSILMKNKVEIKNFLLLDLKKVGSNSGYENEFYSLLKKYSDKYQIYTGGGVRGINDLKNMLKANINGVIVATAIHTGNIAAEDLKVIKQHQEVVS